MSSSTRLTCSAITRSRALRGSPCSASRMRWMAGSNSYNRSLFALIVTSTDLIQNQGFGNIGRQKGQLRRENRTRFAVRYVHSNARQRLFKNVALLIFQRPADSASDFIWSQQTPLAWVLSVRNSFRDSPEHIHIHIRDPAHVLHNAQHLAEQDVLP